MYFVKLRAVFMGLGLLISFSTKAHVNLKNPVGGETFDPGQSVEIKWEILVQHDTKDWDLYFSSDGGNSYEPIATNLSVKTLHYTWNVPYKSTGEGRIKIVQDNTDGDYSDESGNFTIAGVSTASEKPSGPFSVSVFPNPTSDIVHLGTAQSKAVIEYILLLDNFGRKITTLAPVIGDEENEYSLDVSSRISGLYFLVIYTQKGVEVRKLVVK